MIIMYIYVCNWRSRVVFVQLYKISYYTYDNN